MFTLEDDVEDVADLDYGDVIRVRFVRSPGHPVELRIDIGGSPVRIQDRADGLKHIQSRRVVKDRIALIEHKLAALVLDKEG